MATDVTDSAGDTAPDREEGGATDCALDGGGRMLFFLVGATGAGRGIPAMQFTRRLYRGDSMCSSNVRRKCRVQKMMSSALKRPLPVMRAEL